MTDKNFADLYCIQNQIDRARYEREVLVRSLFPHARLFAWWMLFFTPQSFAADMDFVRSVGDLRRFRDFEFEAHEYAHHPANRGFLRKFLYIRVSARALRRMVRETLHHSVAPDQKVAEESAVPFKNTTPAKAEKQTGSSSPSN